MVRPPAPLYHDPPDGDKAPGVGLGQLRTLLVELHQTMDVMGQAVKALGAVVARAEAAHQEAVKGWEFE